MMQGHPSLVLRKLSGLTGGSGSVDAAKRSHSLGEDERGNHDKGVGMVAAMRNLRAVVLRNSRCLGEATSRRTRVLLLLLLLLLLLAGPVGLPACLLAGPVGLPACRRVSGG